MSGSIDLSSLFDTTDSSSLLNAIYGIVPSGGADPNALQSLDLAERNQTQDIATTAKQPQIARDIAAFQSAVASATDPATLLKNPAVLKVLLTANGLSDELAYPALAQKALLSDPKDTSSLVNQLTDTRWKTVAANYNFATHGLSVLQSAATLSSLANAYAENSWRASLDATTPGLSNALTFRAAASGVTTVDQILSDPTLRSVVTTALGIPEQIAFQDLDAQEKSITDQLDITRLQDPHFVESFTQQYLLAAQSAAQSSSPSITDLATQAAGLVV